MKTIFTIFSLCFCLVASAQTTITGNVVDAASVPVAGANVIVDGTATGTATDFDGNFKLTTDKNPPFSITISSVGYQSVTQEVTSNNQSFSVVLNEGNELDEVVVSASRTPESVRESPVTIERFDVKDVKFATSPNFYTSLENLKGVDVNRSSLTFNSVNTRGFATFANTRFVQLIDGMDNSSPALNFVLGNFVGLNELDVKSVELLPGASSALYGANAFNGILFMTSKSPFEDQGISAYIKYGLTSQEEAGDNKYYDFGVRAAHKFSDKFAAKASFSYLYGTEWYASDTNEYVLTQPGFADQIIPFGSGGYAHDALNIYGDEVATDINGVAQALEGLGLIPAGASNLVPSVTVGRDGYFEKDLTDYIAKSGKFDGTLMFRPWADDKELILQSRVGFGNTIYQGANRYQLKNFTMFQHKLEFRGDNFFLRGYYTTEDAGDSYDMRFTGINLTKINATEWFGTYVGAYLQSVLGGVPSTQAHAIARGAANDAYSLIPGTPQFNVAFNRITNDPDIATGSKFLDNTSSLTGEGNYNFKKLLNNVVDLQVGGSYKQYSLDSGGTIFTDYDGPIKYNEYGAYMQASKKFAEDRLKITGSIRYDKNEFFDGTFSPRLSFVYSAGENKQHNFRASYQTGFRNPDTQSLFIGFNVGRALLVGSSPDNLDRRLPGTNLTGRDAYFNSYSLASVQEFAATGDPTVLQVANSPLVEQEKVQAIDVGYRGKIGPVNVDLNGFYNIYQGFISNKLVVTPISGNTADASGIQDVATGNVQVFQLYTNSLADVKSFGAVIGLSTKFAKKFKFGVNYTYSDFDFNQSSDPDFRAGFNTPKNYVKATLSSRELFKNFGFSVNARWKDSYLWESSIANAVMPEVTVVDAQLNYSVPSIKSTFKIGGTNLGGTEYQSAVGTGNVGSMYYISWTINN